CAGNAWRGRLRVQQRAVGASVVAAIDVPGAPVRGVWTARCVAEYNIGGVIRAAADDVTALSDRFLVVSRDSSTSVFAVADGELQEIERTGFFTRGATLLVAELLACTRVVQVHAHGLRLVTGESAREAQTVAVASEIVAAEAADPLVLLRLATGAHVAYEADAESRLLRLVPTSELLLRCAVHVALFRDAHRVLATNTDVIRISGDRGSSNLAVVPEFDSLYADEDHRAQRKRLTAATQQTVRKKTTSGDKVYSDEMPLYAAVLLASGDLSILRMPECEPVWTTRRFDALPATLIPSPASEPSPADDAAPSMRVEQVRLAQLGSDSSSCIETLHLVALTTAGELAVYRAFEFADSREEAASHLALRFTRVSHDVFAYEPEYERRVLRAQQRQLAAFAAWSEADKERLEERAAEERVARERALEKAKREEEAVVADWGDDSDEEAEEEREGGSAGNKILVPPVDQDDLYADAYDTRDVFADKDEETEEPEVVPEKEEEPEEKEDIKEEEEEVDEDPLDLLEAIVRKPKLTFLENIGGFSAVVVTGARPALVLVGPKRYARVHPLSLPPTRLPATLQQAGGGDFDVAVAAGLLTLWQPIVGVARFHSSPGCEHGFVALGQAGTLTIGGLPEPVSSSLRGGMDYDAPWPTRCIPPGTAHPGLAPLGGIAFHPPSASYAVATASITSFFIKEPNPDIAARDANAPTGIDQPLISEHERRDLPTTSLPPAIPRHHVDLLSPVTWETVDSHSLAANEHIVAMHTLTLDSDQAASGCKPFLCLATSFVLGEDVASRGKIYIFDIVDIVPLPGRPQTNRKLRLLFQEEIRGCISALSELRGNLAVSLGSKVLIRSFQCNEALESVAFLDCQAWVRSLAGFKNFLLIGDLLNSLWFAGFQEEGPTRLQVLGRDFTNQLPVEFADFLVSPSSQLELVAADAFGCLHFFMYAPRDAHSLSGQKLLRRGEYNLRSRITAMRRLVAQPMTAAARQQACVVATASGAIYAVAMLPEKTFKRLHRINTQLVHGTEHLAGLNPREFRAVPIYQRQFHAPKRTVLDADLLIPLFAHGSLALQRETAQRDGTTADRVLRDIADIEKT
ncbi:mRNA cleavage and polyadenylation factor subunit, partial [Coemansia aciculifera]